MSLTFPPSLAREGLQLRPPAKKTLWIDKVHDHEREDSSWMVSWTFGKWLQYDGNYYFAIGSPDVGKIRMSDWYMLRFYGVIVDEK